MQKEYETQRLVLRLSSPFLAGEIQSFYMRNREFFSKYETVDADAASMTLAEFAHCLEADEKQSQSGHDYRFWLFLKGSETCIGCVAITNIVRGNMQYGYLNYKLDEKRQHHGYMLEAVRFCISFAFEKLGLHRLEADILPGNYMSIRVVQKLHFKNAGLAEKLINVNGAWRDHIRMILINPCG